MNKEKINELTVDETITFHVPKEIAENPHNRFYGVTDFSDMDGPWWFLAFIKNNLNHLCFHMCDVFPESLEWPEFNPLDSSGFLSLRLEEFERVISITKEIKKSNFMDDNQKKNNPNRYFKLLDRSEISKYGMDRVQFLYSEMYPEPKERYYIQDVKTNSEEITILKFHWIPRSNIYQRISFQIINFSKKDLDDQSYKPQDNGIAKICFDRNGFSSFLDILRSIKEEVKADILTK